MVTLLAVGIRRKNSNASPRRYEVPFPYHLGNWVDDDANHRGREWVRIAEWRLFFFNNRRDLSMCKF